MNRNRTLRKLDPLKMVLFDDMGVLPEDPLRDNANFYMYAIGAGGFLHEFNTVMVGAAALHNEMQSVAAVREQVTGFGEMYRVAAQIGARGNLVVQDVGGRTDDSSTWTAFEPCAGFQQLLTGRRSDVASNQVHLSGRRTLL